MLFVCFRFLTFVSLFLLLALEGRTWLFRLAQIGVCLAFFFIRFIWFVLASLLCIKLIFFWRALNSANHHLLLLVWYIFLTIIFLVLLDFFTQSVFTKNFWNLSFFVIFERLLPLSVSSFAFIFHFLFLFTDLFVFFPCPLTCSELKSFFCFHQAVSFSILTDFFLDFLSNDLSKIFEIFIATSIGFARDGLCLFDDFSFDLRDFCFHSLSKHSSFG